MNAVEVESLQQWVGRTETRRDVIVAWPLVALAATLDRDDPEPRNGDFVPPLWHWLYFLGAERQSHLDRDGHAARGGFLPPVPLPRRMWAGGRVQWHGALRVGDTATRVSRIASVVHKRGSSGELVFVVVRHDIVVGTRPALTEEHDIVYREARSAERRAANQPIRETLPQAAWTRCIVPDPVLLFRYSALTFNGHRIHYDRRYVSDVEGYPGLVVHGPLIATLLADLLRRERPHAQWSRFDYRAIQPLFDTDAFDVCGHIGADEHKALVWARPRSGEVAMRADVALR